QHHNAFDRSDCLHSRAVSPPQSQSQSRGAVDYPRWLVFGSRSTAYCPSPSGGAGWGGGGGFTGTFGGSLAGPTINSLLGRWGIDTVTTTAAGSAPDAPGSAGSDELGGRPHLDRRPLMSPSSVSSIACRWQHDQRAIGRMINVFIGREKTHIG